jgi:hypothetical protein
MNTKPHALLALLAGSLALLAGCATVSGPDAAQDSTKYTIGNTEKFVPLDKASQAAVACTGLRERVRPDGRFEVIANLKNRDAAPLALQVNCVFRDLRGFPTGDETAFQTIKLGAGATETVRFTAANTLAKRYTIRVREAR